MILTLFSHRFRGRAGVVNPNNGQVRAPFSPRFITERTLPNSSTRIVSTIVFLRQGGVACPAAELCLLTKMTSTMTEDIQRSGNRYDSKPFKSR
jgi:hypothetical protein